MTLKENLIRAKALITDPKNWIQGAFARDANGCLVSSDDPSAVCYCSIGAIKALRLPCNEQENTIDYLYKSIGKLIPDFNDENTHADVMAAWDKAIEKAGEIENDDEE